MQPWSGRMVLHIYKYIYIYIFLTYIDVKGWRAGVRGQGPWALAGSRACQGRQLAAGTTHRLGRQRGRGGGMRRLWGSAPADGQAPATSAGQRANSGEMKPACTAASSCASAARSPRAHWASRTACAPPSRVWQPQP